MEKTKVGALNEGQTKTALENFLKTANCIYCEKAMIACGLDLDTNTVRDMMAGGETTRKALVEGYRKQLEFAFIPSIKNGITSQMSAALDNLDLYINNLIKIYNPVSFIPVECFSVKNRSIICEGADKYIDEHCAIYAETELQFKVLEVQEKIKVAKLELAAVLGPYGVVSNEIVNDWGAINLEKFDNLKNVSKIE